MQPTPRAFARALCALLLPFSFNIATAYPKDYDIVIYGGASGGVTAAVAGAKMGKKVALVSPTKHLGGLTTSGLGWTDLGKTAILGGLSREFYHRIYVHYSAQTNWNSIKGMAGQHVGLAFDQTNQWGLIFEPKVAEKVFADMLAETNVELFTGLLDLNPAGVVMDGQRITSIKLEDGRVFSAKMFIDASYEGDLLAGAGVSFFVGREANAVYGETISGVQNNGTNSTAGVSPYVVKDVPSSGLLPFINATIAPNGTGDGHLQAFCYRMVLTKAANRIPIAKPANYNEADFELLLRNVEKGETTFLKMDMMPNGKTDSNNATAISTDYIGHNWGDGWDWSTLNHQQRAALALEHENYQRGLVWTLQNHPRVKAKVGANGLYSGWGLPADEFTDNNNWPHQLYVREARRMVSGYVMTTKNCTGSVKAADSIGMAAYTMDSHSSQRFNDNGSVKNEGGVGQSVPAPYPISYRSIIPKVGQCENLLVPWCLSSSHMAFGSLRMEPVYMTLGQSAATAAALAINDNVSVQDLRYPKLAAKLRADGVVLGSGPDDSSTTGIIVDNTDATAVKAGAWAESTATAGFYGGNYLHDSNVDKGTKSIIYTPVIPASGTYEVSLRWCAHENRATNVPVKVIHPGGTFTTTVNQRNNGGVWYPLGAFQFEPGGAAQVIVETTGTDGFVIADAARWNPVGADAEVEVFAMVPSAIRGGVVPAEFVFTRKGSTTGALTVNYTTGGTAAAATYSPALTGSVTIPSGLREIRIPLTAPSPAQPAGPKTLQVSLTGGAYLVGASSTATINFRDNPFDAWRFDHFDASQLADPSVSGPAADPDRNGIRNLMEFFTGGFDAPSLFSQDGNLYFKVRRNNRAMDLKMTVWESSDLTNWTLTPELIMPTPVERGGEVQELSIPVKAGSPFSQGRRFYEMRIER